MLIFSVYVSRKCQYLLEEIISHKNIKFVSLRIHLSKKILLRFESLLMFKFWSLPPRSGSHTPRYKVHAFTLVTCFLSDELTSDT